jgi:PAS domain S-box-containing protein/putative nucleotidyltransferase with HDIG domain
MGKRGNPKDDMNELNKTNKHITEAVKAETERVTGQSATQAGKRIEEILKRSENRYRDIVEKAGIAILIDDIDGKFKYFNKKFADLFGYTVLEMKNKTIQSLVHPDDLEEAMDYHKTRLEGKKAPSQYEFKGIRKDGSARYLEVNAELLKEGKKIIGTCSYIWDITDRKLAEAELRKHREQLEELVKERTTELEKINEQLELDITERKQMEDAMRNTAQDWRTTFDGIRDAVCLLDTDGKIRRCNKAMIDLIGKSFSDIIGCLCCELLHGVSEPIENCPMVRMKGSHCRESADFLMEDGWYTVSVDPIFDDAGKITGAVHIIADITERKRAEEALHKEKVYFEQLFETAQEAIVMSDNSGRVLLVNKEFLNLFNYAEEEVIGKFVDQLIVPDDLREEAISITKRVGKGERIGLESIRQRKDGTQIFASILASPIIVNNVQVAVYSIYRDITERKKAEEALRESEEAFRGIFENAPIGIYRTDPQGKILMANPTLVHLLGYSSFEELAQLNLEEGTYYPEYPREEFKKQMDEKGKILSLESVWKTKDGTDIYVSESARAVFDEKGKPIYYEGMIADITERKRVQEELKENYERLQKTMEGTIHAMSRIVETRDPYTAGHQQRVAVLAIAIAKEMGLSDDQIRGLRMAALVHDIGKIYVPAEVLTRPSELPDAEFALIKKHPQVGYDILKTIQFPWPVEDIVLQHHETLDGEGYPQGLKDEEIMLEAKILCVADVVEAMSSHRPYRAARGMEMTLKEISGNRGKRYDPRVVDACLVLFTEKDFTFD